MYVLAPVTVWNTEQKKKKFFIFFFFLCWTGYCHMVTNSWELGLVSSHKLWACCRDRDYRSWGRGRQDGHSTFNNTHVFLCLLSDSDPTSISFLLKFFWKILSSHTEGLFLWGYASGPVGRTLLAAFRKLPSRKVMSPKAVALHI